MKTMHEMHGEPNDELGQHESCPKCSACVTCQDCTCNNDELEGIDGGVVDSGPFAGKRVVLSRHAFKRLVIRRL